MYTTLEGGQILRGLRNIQSQTNNLSVKTVKNTKVNKDKASTHNVFYCLTTNKYCYSSISFLMLWQEVIINNEIGTGKNAEQLIWYAYKRTLLRRTALIHRTDNIDKYLPYLGSYIHCLYIICALCQNHDMAYYYIKWNLCPQPTPLLNVSCISTAYRNIMELYKQLQWQKTKSKWNVAIQFSQDNKYWNKKEIYIPHTDNIKIRYLR